MSYVWRHTCDMSHMKCHVTYHTCDTSHVICHMWRVICDVTHVTCHMWNVKCDISHMWHVTGEMSRVTCHACNTSWDMSHVTCYTCDITCDMSHAKCQQAEVGQVIAKIHTRRLSMSSLSWWSLSSMVCSCCLTVLFSVIRVVILHSKRPKESSLYTLQQQDILFCLLSICSYSRVTCVTFDATCSVLYAKCSACACSGLLKVSVSTSTAPKSINC